MPRAPKQTRANRANGAKAKAQHEAAQSMEQLTAAHATLTAAHAALNADLLSSREQYSQLREWHRSLLVSAGQPAALEAAQKDLAAARTELAHTKQQLTTTNIKLEQLRAQVVEGSRDTVMQLSNGCLCCTVRDDLIQALYRLVGGAACQAVNCPTQRHCPSVLSLDGSHPMLQQLTLLPHDLSQEGSQFTKVLPNDVMLSWVRELDPWNYSQQSCGQELAGHEDWQPTACIQLTQDCIQLFRWQPLQALQVLATDETWSDEGASCGCNGSQRHMRCARAASHWIRRGNKDEKCMMSAPSPVALQSPA
ncbi:hypothetical protein QJQ45_010677 [Haematococcus lacustris]|nr:hypothetical protein QJQ45_010677 [Haematococcus lacustris]